MYKYKYYKHISGRDAVIYVIDSEVVENGFQVEYLWHILNNDGVPMPSPSKASAKFFSYDELENWEIYEVLL